MTPGDLAGRCYHAVFFLSALVLAILILTGCTPRYRDPLAWITADPKAMEVPVITLGGLSF